MTEFTEVIDYELEEQQMEIENRMKNLMWTISGNYKLDTKLDLASFALSKYISMYDAIKQGAFDRYFDKDEFAMYLVKKIYYGASEESLMDLAQLCVECASFPKILPYRPGVIEIRRKAYEDLLEYRFEKLNHNLTGRLKIALMRGTLQDDWHCEQKISDYLSKVRELEHAQVTMDLIRVVDELYNALVDPTFVRKHGDLQHVLDVTLEDLKEFNWQDYLDEVAMEDVLEQYMDQMQQQVTSLEQEDSAKEEDSRKKGARKVILLDKAAVEKMYSYIEKNYGRSYLNEQQQKQVNARLCRGAHADCSLYYTDGVLRNTVMVNAQYVNAKKHAQNNYRLYLNNQNLLKRNVEMMTDFLTRSLRKRSEKEEVPSLYGQIRPTRLWKIGRTDPGNLFTRTIRSQSNEFAVEILMDASGSQRDRQGQVALQALIISEALSNVKIPHQIESFCTFWDYTVMQRFREFDDPPEVNKRVLEFSTSSNNRDGLAIRAAGDTLMKRQEENKILIVLSDGRPNDVIVNRPGSRNPATYAGDYAVQDTAFEVRKLRSSQVCVLGVFTGREKDLEAEKRIFGKDFAYIRDIRNFSKVVSKYLLRLLEQDE